MEGNSSGRIIVGHRDENDQYWIDVKLEPVSRAVTSLPSGAESTGVAGEFDRLRQLPVRSPSADTPTLRLPVPSASGAPVWRISDVTRLSDSLDAPDLFICTAEPLRNPPRAISTYSLSHETFIYIVRDKCASALRGSPPSDVAFEWQT
ncbi:Hypothetical protein NTJ_07786 [Nesidiocoris tenuis]|uniref:Uncharacterized protein n=1 Tax=Nesidiocoris tenuis TaxID=355587 RepID=A0ABN7ARZ6_9HEMI|nr:Hypothetical protein NTJ_07786 [Nesidiocoris tenuis]